MKHYKKESIIAPLFKLLEVVFDLLVPMVVAQIIDVGIAGNNRPYIVSRFGILVLMAAVGLCCSFTAQYFAAKASVGCATELRQAVFDHIQALSFTELDTIGTDTLITRLINDINQVQNGINMGLRLLLRSPFIVFGSVVMAFTVNVKCAIVFLVTIPILFVAVFGIMLVSIPLFKKVQAALDRVTGMTRENLNGVRVIRAFCREEQSVADFEKSNDELTCLNEFVGKISALLNPLTYVLINIAAVVLIWQAGLQVNIGSMQQGQVVALYNYMLQIIVELIKLASLILPYLFPLDKKKCWIAAPLQLFSRHQISSAVCMHSADDRFDLVSVLRQPLSLRHARGTPLTADHKNFVPRQTDPFEQMVIGKIHRSFHMPFFVFPPAPHIDDHRPRFSHVPVQLVCRQQCHACHILVPLSGSDFLSCFICMQKPAAESVWDPPPAFSAGIPRFT